MGICHTLNLVIALNHRIEIDDIVVGNKRASLKKVTMVEGRPIILVEQSL